uniref:G-protein coupled receptors family 1 profile domain-containing protein n=1 Tax=Plectus sambesii TaxID=2011161 RepID=A0A914X1U2_9BILA
MFFAPKTCKLLFDRPRIYYILIIPWISGFIVDGGYIFIGNCFKSYNHVGFNFWYDCSANTTTAGLIQRQFQSYFTNVVPLLSLVMYLAVYLKMRRDQQAVMSSHQRVIAMNKSRRERSFLIQALIICLSLAFESFLFQLVPYLARKNIIDCPGLEIKKKIHALATVVLRHPDCPSVPMRRLRTEKAVGFRPQFGSADEMNCRSSRRVLEVVFVAPQPGRRSP